MAGRAGNYNSWLKENSLCRMTEEHEADHTHATQTKAENAWIFLHSVVIRHE
jgi:hypothetical protein